VDILTPKGQRSRLQEIKAVELWHQQYPSLRYCETPKDKPAVVDAILVRDGIVVGVVETKCRSVLTMDKFRHHFDEQWLVTAEKIRKGAKVAEFLHVPFIGFFYLAKEDALYFETLWKPNKGWNVKIETKMSKTQATVNGGKIVRENAYIDMTNAKILMGHRIND